jgi:hypothetical protein
MSLSGAILDQYSQEALMSLGASEGLIESRTETDGVFEKIVGRQPEPIVRNTLLEQIVLTPNIVFANCHDFLWTALSGSLFDEGRITNLSSDEKSDEIESLSLEMLAGMLLAAGHPMPIEEIQRRATAAHEASCEEAEFTERTGKEPASEIGRVIGEAFGWPTKYSPEEYAAQQRRMERFVRSQELLRSFSERPSLLPSTI